MHILIAGGGIIGLSIARSLRQAGASVTVIERGRCGEEASWAAAGMLSPQAETKEGDPLLDVMLASRDLYPRLADALLEENGIDIELDRRGTLYFAFNDDDAQYLRTRYEWQTAAGLPVEMLSADEARRTEPFASPSVRSALYFPEDWQVDNRKLLAALIRYAELNGIEMIENTSVTALEITSGHVTGVETSSGARSADQVVLTTGAWTSLIKLGGITLPFKVEPVKGQMLLFRTAKRLFDHIIYSLRGYLVPRADGRVLAGSTSEFTGFDRSVTELAVSEIRAMAVEISPNLASLIPVDHWSGLRPMAPDGLPVIGSIAGIRGLTVATGHYRNGILLAPLTAAIVADKLLRGVEHPALVRFGPDRFRFAAASAPES